MTSDNDLRRAAHINAEKLMTSDRAALREKVAKAIAETQDEDWENPALFLVDANDTAESAREAYRDMADAAIAVVLEEAAKVAEREGVTPYTNIAHGGPDWYRHGRNIAAAIRAMKSSPGSGS
jgi:hypothetical protein